MSRIGRLPIELPSGVEFVVDNGKVTVKGKLGELSQVVDTCINISVENNTVVLTRNSEEKEVKAKHGLYRALLSNMVKGVSEGFRITVVAKGVGYRIQKQGEKLVLSIGYSKPVEVEPVEGIKFELVDADKIAVCGIDKEKVGQVAAKIRSLRPVEPYHGYGLRYLDEVVIKKEGKKAPMQLIKVFS